MTNETAAKESLLRRQLHEQARAKMVDPRVAELDALAEKATPGEWQANPQRLMVGNQAGPIMSYLVGTGLHPEGMKVSLGSERVADHHFVAALVNAWRTWLRDAAVKATTKRAGGERFSDKVHETENAALRAPNPIERGNVQPPELVMLGPDAYHGPERRGRAPNPGWVSVEERLPEPYARVLVHGDAPFVAGLENGVWALVNDAYLQPGEVTHWMPLPAAPHSPQTNPAQVSVGVGIASMDMSLLPKDDKPAAAGPSPAQTNPAREQDHAETERGAANSAPAAGLEELRERCAKVCESYAQRRLESEQRHDEAQQYSQANAESFRKRGAIECAAAIRAMPLEGK